MSLANHRAALTAIALFASGAPAAHAQPCSGIFDSGYFCGNSAATGGPALKQSPKAMANRAFGSTPGAVLTNDASGNPTFVAGPVLGVPGAALGSLGLAGNISGTATIRPQAAAGTPTLTLPNTSGTFAVGATSPLVLSATTGGLSIGLDSNFTTSGSNLALAPIASGSLIANSGAGSAEPTAATPSAWLSRWCSATADQVPYSTGASTWGCLGLLGTAHTWTAAQTFNLNATAAPAATVAGNVINIAGADATTSAVTITAFGNGGQVAVRGTGGTNAAPSALTTNGFMGLVAGYGYQGSNGYSTSSSAYVAFVADGNWSNTSWPGRIDFATTPSGSTAIATNWRMGNDGSFISVGVTGGSKGALTANIAGVYDTGNRVANTATAPVTLNAASGIVACATCVTSSGGGAISGTAPIAVSAAGVVSINAPYVSLTASNGGVVTSGATNLAILAGTATARQMLQSGASTTPAWSTTTWPATTTINRLLYSSAANVISDLATANSSILVTDSGGIPSLSTTLPAHTLGGTISGGGNQINNAIIGTTTPLASFFTTTSASTSVTSPLVIGGTGTGSSLTFETTSGAGATDFMSFLTGSQAEHMRITSAGLVGVGTNLSGINGSRFVVNQNTATVTVQTVGAQMPMITMMHADSSFSGISGYTFGTTGPQYNMYMASGTGASPTDTASGTIGAYVWKGYANGTYRTGAAIFGTTSEAWTNTANGMHVSFFTTPIGTASSAEALRVHGSGGISISTTSDPGIGLIYTNSASFMIRTKTSYATGAGAGAGTITNAPSAGNPTKWIPIDDNGTTRYVPAW